MLQSAYETGQGRGVFKWENREDTRQRRARPLLCFWGRL